MKKVLLIVAALFIGLQANAQLSADGGYIHAFENWNFGKGLGKDDASLDGFYAGAKYNMSLENLVEGLSLQPGANLSFLFGPYLHLDNLRIHEVALNVPVMARYSFDIMSDFTIYGLAGPTFQLGLIHNVAHKDSGSIDPLYNNSNDVGTYRNRFQIYMGLGAGIEVAQMIQVTVGFDLGLLNMSADHNLGIGRNVLKIGVGYIF